MSTFSPPTNKNNEVLTPLTNVLFSRARSDSDGAGSRRRATAASYDGRGNVDKQLDIRLPVWDSDIVKCQKKLQIFAGVRKIQAYCYFGSYYYLCHIQTIEILFISQ